MSLAESAAWRSYFWPGAEILRNKLGIRDADELEAVERQLTRQRLREAPPPAPLTPAGYCALHRHIFQDLYDWWNEASRASFMTADPKPMRAVLAPALSVPV